MGNKFSPGIPDAALHRPGDTDYLRELLAAAGLSQRGAAKVLGIAERSMRYKCTGDMNLEYSEQFLLETIADKVRQGEADMNAVMKEAPKKIGTDWTHSGEREITRDDAGKLIVGFNKYRQYVFGRISTDGFGVVIKSPDDLDMHVVPLNDITTYALLDPPVE